MISLESCHVGRYFIWNLADIKDYKRFPSQIIEPSADVLPLAFAEPIQPGGIERLYEGRFRDFDALFKKTGSVAFLIVKQNQIVFEQYSKGYDSTSLIPSFSIAKSVVSAMTGIALEDGYFDDVSDPVTKYLPSGFHPSLSQIRIIDLLNMQAGLNFREAYNTPFSPMAKYYYGRQLDSYVRKLKVITEPGTEYNYQSASTQLLGMAIEHASGKSLMAYFEEKIWKPAGMAQEATWSLDKPGGRGKFFCCLNARPRDFARFGLLYADNGRRDNTQIIPEEWIQALQHETNGSSDSQGYPYLYKWRATPEGGMFAKGILGQYVYVNPAKELVVVRLGKKSAGLDWGILFTHLASTLNN